MVPDYVLDSGLQAAGEAVLVSQAAQQAQLQVRPVFIEKCVWWGFPFQKFPIRGNQPDDRQTRQEQHVCNEYPIMYMWATRDTGLPKPFMPKKHVIKFNHTGESTNNWYIQPEPVYSNFLIYRCGISGWVFYFHFAVKCRLTSSLLISRSRISLEPYTQISVQDLFADFVHNSSRFYRILLIPSLLKLQAISNAHDLPTWKGSDCFPKNWRWTTIGRSISWSQT